MGVASPAQEVFPRGQCAGTASWGLRCNRWRSPWWQRDGGPVEKWGKYPRPRSFRRI